MSSTRDRLLAFRRALPQTPRLDRRMVSARGLEFSVNLSPAVSDAPPLLCINGGLLYGHEQLWPSLAALARTRQVILYDQRGRGRSSVPPGARSATIEHDVLDIPALRVALGIERWDLLGHSWGGGLAMLAAERDAGAVGRLVLVDSVGPDGSWQAALVPDALPRLDAEDARALQRITRADLANPDPEFQSAYAAHMFHAWFADPEFARTIPKPKSDSVTGSAVSARLRGGGYDWTERIRAIRAPSLVIHGASDLLPVQVAERVAGTIPDARLVVLPGSGHMPFWESPEEFFATVEDFLDPSRQSSAASLA